MQGSTVRAGGGRPSGTRAARADDHGTELERLLAKLKEADLAERDRAARSLGALGDSRAATSLARALHDVSDEVRWAAAGALSQLGDSRGAEFYVAAVRHGSSADRWAAVWALGDSLQRGDRRALGPLREALNDSNSEVCAAARTLLGAEPF
jgi:bilin biosynthesis protein